jgi:hypothetical protein
MRDLAQRLKAYIDAHPFDSGDSDCESILDQLYQAYAESHESDPAEIGDGFKELEEFLCELPLEDNNAVFNLCCRLCSAYERKAFCDGLQYGTHLIMELSSI